MTLLKGPPQNTGNIRLNSWSLWIFLS